MDPLFIRALQNQPVERPPVWMMRQAGRYLSEYRALKEKHTFLEMCKSVELALEVSMQPMRILEPDAAIVFADILLPLEGMGIGIDFNPGPKIRNPIAGRSDIERLQQTDPYISTGYVLNTISALKRELDNVFMGHAAKAVIGFAGAPWTLACYIVEQGPFKHFHGTQVFAEQDRPAMHLLLEKLTAVVSDYLVAQVESGAQVIQLFDSWAGILSAAAYREFSQPYTAAIFERVRSAGAHTILYVNGSSHLVEQMSEVGADCLSIDWRTSLAETADMLGPEGIVQGNLDPTRLFAPREEVISSTMQMLRSVRRRAGYIANLGHGILPLTPRENAIAFIETVKAGWPRDV